MSWIKDKIIKFDMIYIFLGIVFLGGFGFLYTWSKIATLVIILVFTLVGIFSIPIIANYTFNKDDS